MGLIVYRWIPRKNEEIVFPAIPPRWGFLSGWKPSQAQEVELEGVRSHNPLYITPYVLGGSGYDFSLNDEETAYQRTRQPTAELGLDVKYGLTSNLTLDVTLNTDFAQVEADDQQVNLTRFSLFFPRNGSFSKSGVPSLISASAVSTSSSTAGGSGSMKTKKKRNPGSSRSMEASGWSAGPVPGTSDSWTCRRLR